MRKRRMLGTAAAAAWLVCAGAAAAQQQSPQATEPVVVTATRTPVPAGGAIGSLDVVTGAEIDAAAAQDVKAALDLVPSLIFNDSGSPAGVATLSLRGSTSSQVLVLLDGRRLANAQSSWFSFNDLPVPVERIDRVEVMPTPASALYGADALGGVVNIITKPVGTRPELNLSFGGGSDNEWRTAGGAQFGLGSVGVRLDGQLRSGDGYRDNGDFDLKSVIGTARVAPAPWGMTLSWQELDREAGVPGPEAFPSPEARQDDSRRSLAADVFYVPGRSWDIRTGVFWNRQELDFNDPNPPDFDPAFPASPIASRHENESKGADFQWNFDTGRGELYSIGGEWAEDGIESTNDGDHEHTRWGLFAQDQWRAGSWSAVGAVRRDDHSVYGAEWSPSLSVGWEAGGWRLWGAGARGYRAPNFDDLYWNETFLKGNPDLKPETSWSWEGGLGWRSGERGGVRLNYFRRTVDDLIRWAPAADNPFVYQPQNIAEATISGWEAEVLYRPVPALAIPVGYQRLSTEDETTGEEIPGAVRSLWRAAAQYTGGAFTWSLEGAYTDRGTFQFKDGDWDYFVMNAALTWKGKLGGLPTHASVRWENLQDKEYETVEGYPMPGSAYFVEVGIGL